MFNGWKRDGIRRAKRTGDQSARGDDPFLHASGREGLAELVEDHLLYADAAEATAAWRPSRRGNSPRGTGKVRSIPKPE